MHQRVVVFHCIHLYFVVSKCCIWTYHVVSRCIYPNTAKYSRPAPKTQIRAEYSDTLQIHSKYTPNTLQIHSEHGVGSAVGYTLIHVKYMQIQLNAFQYIKIL